MLLVFTRPFTAKFTDCYEESFNGKVLFISDFKGTSECDPMSYVYSHHRGLSEEEKYSELNYYDIIARDRFLRFQVPDLSKRLINGVWGFLNELFEQNEICAYIGMPVDNYIQHLIILKCRMLGIKAISPVHSPIPNKLRVTNLGEYIPTRNPDKEEIMRVISVFENKTFKPIWLSNNRTGLDVFKLYLKERVKKVAFYYLKLLNKDPWSFHYNCIYPMKGAITVHSLDVLQIPKLFLKTLDSIKPKFKDFKNIAYLALQFNPEASINYLIEDHRFSQYDLLIENIIDALPDDTLLLVKEHPDIYGYRPLKFYDKFQGKDNVCLLDTAIPTSNIIELSDFILVTGSASTGMEAVVKKKTVISFGGAFYQVNNVIHEIRDFLEVSAWSEYLVKINLTDELVYQFMKFTLSNTIDADYEGLVRSKITLDSKNIDTTLKLLEYLRV